ncbi:MAG: biotin/lipoyl-binding protein, partial [Chloroflexi bacterium]|nr:biotin/lipoyl-binding protein [Chloroflexota bacterium]
MSRLTKCLSLLFVLGSLSCRSDTPISIDSIGATPASDATITSSGFIEADDVTITSEVSAQVVELAADEGQTVEAGQMLVRLDDTLMQAQRIQAEAAVQAAQAASAQVLAGPRPDAVAASEAALAGAQANLLGARRAVTDAAAMVADPPGLAVQIVQAELEVKLAEQAIQKAQSTHDQVEALRDLNRVGTVERDIQEKNLAAAQAELEAAKAQYDGAVASLDQLDHMRQSPVELIANLNSARSNAQVADANVWAAQAALALAQAGATEEDVALAKADVAAAEANLALIEEQLTRYRLSSPISGVVTSRLVQNGEIASAGTPLLVVSDLGEVKLVVYVQ